ncbi:hypothetical protein HF685_00490 [Parasphingorhabdus halotolerans]|uniref:Uncharacterized protein n=1 Tax=Parasphingorhabdus halotolerans TaxID=2725558 RepID=A0A6H2DJ52_9SPHN|nr:hypothetical protein HF685_00490 [Parasphingorhabdus halotolerans]
MTEETAFEPIGSRFRLRFFLYVLMFLLLVGFIVLWFGRTSIADSFLRDELDKLDVEASYEISDIGFNKQVIRNLVIGDPSRPDLTAELVEVGNSLTLQGAGINWVRASGVKLFGRLADGKLSFGELDKFTDPEDDSPLALPDIWLGLSNAKLKIDSEYGAIGVSLNGEGNLQNGFSGEMAAISKQLAFGGCSLADPTYFGKVAIKGKKPKLQGPLRLPQVQCAEMDLSAEDMAARISVELGSDFASWNGNAGLIGGPVKYVGYSTQELKTTARFKGDMAQSSGDIDLTASGLRSPYGGADIGRFSGPFKLGYGDAQMTVSFEGSPSLRAARLNSAMLGQASSIAASAAGSPVGPVAAKLSGAVQGAGKALDMSSDMRFETGAKGTTLALDTLGLRSRSGAVMSLSNPMLLSFTQKNIRMLADGNIRLQGGGFPTALLVLNDGSLSRGFSGRLEMANYEAGASSLRIPALSFSPARRGGTNIDGRFMLSGPIADGQITGLQMPISGSLASSGRFTLFRQCVDLQFASLRVASLTAGPTKTRLCPQGLGGIVSSRGGGVNIAADAPSIRLNGAVGGTPLSVSSGALGFSLAKGMMARNVAVRLGAVGSQSEFDIALLGAVFGRNITGTIAGAKGKIANVPLLMEDIEARWRYAGGEFLADAQLRVRDEKQVERFRPVISKDVLLKFANSEIVATGTLQEPTTERAVATVDMVHRLENNTGQALLNVSRLTFDKDFQPELLTPLTLGVIANVDGSVTGTGQINWDNSEDGVKSTGVFRTNSINLAAAFGPVTGLSGDIKFTDLLGLETGPGQKVLMAEVNPGVAVFNGFLNYRLLPDYKMQIEGGEWPFAGGMLYLEPTVMDMGEDRERRLEFTVKGVDAAQFLSQFDFENLAATGVFDGKLPMVFDQDGGRVVGGIWWQERAVVHWLMSESLPTKTWVPSRTLLLTL